MTKDYWEGYVPEPDKRQQALDKKAENARDLGLDYEPAKDNSNYRFDPPGLDPSHQKPVAWWIPKAKQFCLPSSDGTRPFAKAWEPLYTSPPAQQEPVACFSVFRSISGERNTRFLELASLPDGEHYFYTSPPSLSLAQRTWQGLTDKELQPIADEYRILFGSWVEDFARAIEAKLKEKNT